MNGKISTPKMNDKATRVALQAARTALVLDQPFFGVLALRLKFREDPTCATTWVDGETLGYNREHVDSLTHSQLLSTLARSVMHCASGHPWRRDARNEKRWSQACNRAINHELQAARFEMPAGCTVTHDDVGKSAEWIFGRMREDEEQEGGRDGEGDRPRDPNSPDEVRDAPTDDGQDVEQGSENEGANEAEWKAAVTQAAKAAQAQGKLPGDLQRYAKLATAPRVDWRSVLRRFITETAAADYAWHRRSTRYAARGLYLPALHSERLGPILVAVDTSGSIDDVLLAQFASEIKAIVDETQPIRTHVVYCDARIQGVETFEQGDEIVMKAQGGGGTDFEPVFDLLRDADIAFEDAPMCVIYLTDLFGHFPSLTPETPTLWVVPSAQNKTPEQPPFGELIAID